MRAERWRTWLAGGVDPLNPPRQQRYPNRIQTDCEGIMTGRAPAFGVFGDDGRFRAAGGAAFHAGRTDLRGHGLFAGRLANPCTGGSSGAGAGIVTETPPIPERSGNCGRRRGPRGRRAERQGHRCREGRRSECGARAPRSRDRAGAGRCGDSRGPAQGCARRSRLPRQRRRAGPPATAQRAILDLARSLAADTPAAVA